MNKAFFRRASFRAGVFIALTVLSVIAVLVISVSSDRTFVTPTTARFAASRDPAVIARGRALAYGAAHCVECHGDPQARARGEINAPLTGGRSWSLGSLGTIHATNITSARSGIGSFTDPELARVLRYGVSDKDRALYPLMSYAGLADDDVVALISFLRSTAPVENQVPADRWRIFGRVVRAWFLKPHGPDGGIAPEHVKPEVSAEYGRYLATWVAGCVSCHTRRNPMTASYGAPPFTGTADAPGVGRIAGWSQEKFIERFRSGKRDPGSDMPWGELKSLSDDDLRAIYLYLTSLPH